MQTLSDKIYSDIGYMDNVVIPAGSTLTDKRINAALVILSVASTWCVPMTMTAYGGKIALKCLDKDYSGYFSHNTNQSEWYLKALANFPDYVCLTIQYNRQQHVNFIHHIPLSDTIHGLNWDYNYIYLGF